MNRRIRHLNPASCGAVVAIDVSKQVVAADDSDIDTLVGNAGTSQNLTQSSTSRPKYKTGILGGNPIARFDGSDDWLDNTSLSVNSPSTVFIVAKCGSKNQSLFHFYATSEVAGLFYWHNNSNRFGFNAWAGDSYGFTRNMTGFSIITALIANGAPSSNGASIWIDGIARTLSQLQGTTTSKTLTTGFNIGKGGANGITGGQGLSGDLAAIYIIPGNLNPSLRKKIEQHLAFKFKLTS